MDLIKSFLLFIRKYFYWVFCLLGLEEKVKKEKEKIIKGIREEFTKSTNTKTFEEKMDFDSNVINDKISGAVYNHIELLETQFAKAAKVYSYINPLHIDIFKATREMEVEVIDFIKDLLNAPEGSLGVMTTGGTESIILSVKAYKGLYMNKLISKFKRPNIIVPESIHAGFDKACQLMEIDIIKVPVVNGAADIQEMIKYENSSTIMYAMSAPSYPHGIIDDVSKLSKLTNVPIHLDSCLGGFITGYLDYCLDFRVQGVSSISIDPHKYGYAPKGSSVVIFREKEMGIGMYSLVQKWMGGIYATPTLVGSRSGYNVATTWIAIRELSKYYKENARKISTLTKRLAREIRKLNLEVIGNPEICVVAMKTGDCSIYGISSEMTKRGWIMNNLQNPPAIHFCVTAMHITDSDEFIKRFIGDLRESIKHKGNGKGTIYGTSVEASSEILGEVLEEFLYIIGNE